MQQFSRLKTEEPFVSKKMDLELAMNPLVEIYLSRSTDVPHSASEYGSMVRRGRASSYISLLLKEGLIESSRQDAHSYCLTVKGKEYIGRAYGGR